MHRRYRGANQIGIVAEAMNIPWPRVKLKEVLNPVNRGEPVDPLHKYRLLGVRLDGHGPFLRETVLGTQTAANRLYRVSSGDFIYSRLFACRGAFGVIGADLNGCYVSGEFPTFLPVKAKIDIDFLRYWFRLADILDRVNEDCTGSTPLTRNRFNERFFLALEIPLPPLAEQRRIVAQIESFAAKIAEARSVRESAESDLRGMLGSAFQEIIEQAPQRPFGEVAPLIRRAESVAIEGRYPELGIRSFGHGTFHKPALTGFELGNKRVFRIEAGDLIFTNVFAWEGAIAVAEPGDAGRFGSHRYITCVPKEGVATSRFLCFYFLTPNGLAKIGEASPGGAGRNRTLGLDALAKIEVPVPRIELQHWFDELQGKVSALRRLQAETAAELDALLPSILDRAFKGEL